MSIETIYTDLIEQASRRGDRVALRYCRSASQTQTTTYAQLASMARDHACGFAPCASLKIVPLLLPKSPPCVAAMLGAIGAGKAFACLNRKLRWPQIEQILSAIGPTQALIDGLAAQTLAAGSPDRTTQWRLITDAPLPPHQQKAVEKLRERIDLQPHTPSTLQTLPTLHTTSSPACCLFTSGSTGVPKGVLISESDLRARAAAEVVWFGLNPDDVLLNILPFSFDVGLNQLLSALRVGCEIVLLDSWLPADILRAAQQFNVTGISAVPAIWTDMLSAKMAFDPTGPHKRLRYITLSGGDLPKERLERLPSLAPGVGIFKTYGQSEAFRATSLRPEYFSSHPTSAGRPFAGVHVYVARPDQTQCAPNEVGEIIHTGLGVMMGYLESGDELTRTKLRPNPFFGADDPAKLAIFTGDMGYLDADGFLFVQGRRDAMLKVAGNRVYPGEIVAQLLASGGLREAEIVGVKTPDGQTQLVAFVILEGTQSIEELRRVWANRLPTYMMPRQAVVLKAMPRTANGKPDVPALMQMAKELPGLEGR